MRIKIDQRRDIPFKEYLVHESYGFNWVDYYTIDPSIIVIRGFQILNYNVYKEYYPNALIMPSCNFKIDKYFSVDPVSISGVETIGSFKLSSLMVCEGLSNRLKNLVISL